MITLKSTLDKVQLELNASTQANAALTAQLAEAQTKATQLEATIAELKASTVTAEDLAKLQTELTETKTQLETSKTDLVSFKAQMKTAEALAIDIAAGQGVPPVALNPADTMSNPDVVTVDGIKMTNMNKR